MTSVRNYSDPFESFDRKYEADHAPEIALERGRLPDGFRMATSTDMQVALCAAVGTGIRLMRIVSGNRN